MAKSIVTNLKKLAARLTTANGRVSALPPCQCIADVVKVMTDTLNVDSNGKLVVSDLVDESTPSGDYGLLQEPIVANSFADSGNSATYLGRSLGLEVDKYYNVKYTYGGVQRTVVLKGVTGGDTGVPEGGVGLEKPAGGDMSFSTPDDIIEVWLLDKVEVKPEEESILYKDGECTVICFVEPTDLDTSKLPLSIDSIEEGDGNLLLGEVSPTKYDLAYIEELGRSVGLKANTSYNVVYESVIDGTSHTNSVSATAQDMGNGISTLGIDCEEEPVISVQLYDNCKLVGDQGTPTYTADECTIIAQINNSDEQPVEWARITSFKLVSIKVA